MDYQISFCLFLSNSATLDTLSTILFNNGIFNIKCFNYDEVLDALEKNKFDFIIVDFDFGNEVSFKLVNFLKENEKYKDIYIIGTSFNAKESFIKELQKYNLVYFFVKPIQETIFQEKIEKIISKFKEHFPKRKHIRIKPPEEEIVRVNFKLKSIAKRISGKVIDLSLGGLGIELYNFENETEIKDGNLIEHVIFELNSKEVDVDAKIVKQRNNFIAVNFTHFYRNSYDILYNYITKQLLY